MGSKSASKRLSIDDSSSDTAKRSRGDMTSEGSTTASQPVLVQRLAETKSMDDFVHDADHVLLMLHGISSGLDVCSTDGSSSNERSLGT